MAYSARLLLRSTFQLVTLLPVIILFKDHVGETMHIAGSSMSPALNPTYHYTGSRDVVWLNKRLPAFNLERGMIVVFRSPTKDPDQWAVKRIIGLEGDRVRTRKPYEFEEVDIPKGHVWVEGLEGSSLDSNTYGPVSPYHPEFQ